MIDRRKVKGTILQRKDYDYARHNELRVTPYEYTSSPTIGATAETPLTSSRLNKQSSSANASGDAQNGGFIDSGIAARPLGVQDLPTNIQEKITVNTTSGCWIWTAQLEKDGHGRSWRNGKAIYAHRLTYEAVKGKIPDGLVIDHLCRVRCCVNPDHLEAVTIKVNTERGISSELLRQRQLSKTHCPQGHKYIGDNLIVEQTTGKRRCKQCRVDQRKHGNAPLPQNTWNGQRIRSLRKRLNLSARKFGHLLGFPGKNCHITIYRHETDKIKPSIQTVMILEQLEKSIPQA